MFWDSLHLIYPDFIYKMCLHWTWVTATTHILKSHHSIDLTTPTTVFECACFFFEHFGCSMLWNPGWKSVQRMRSNQPWIWYPDVPT
jgi:hypothetical protein